MAELQNLLIDFQFLFQKMRRSFSVRYWKAPKNQTIVFYIYEKHEFGGAGGRAKYAFPF